MWKPTILKFFLIASVFFPALAYPAAPPAGSLKLRINFKDSQGMFNFYQSQNIPDNSAKSLRNVDFLRNGSLTPALGISSYAVTLGAVAYYLPGLIPSGDIFVFFSSASPNIGIEGDNFFIAKFSTSLHFIQAGGGRPGIGSFDRGIVAEGFTTQIDGANFGKRFFLVSSNNSGMRIGVNPTAPTSLEAVYLSTISNGQCAAVHLSRLLVSCFQSSPTTIDYSKDDNPQAFPIENKLTLTGSDTEGDRVIGMGPTLLQNLPIYTLNTTRLMTGTEFPDFGVGGNLIVRVISSDVGCINRRTIKNLGNRQYFYSGGINGRVPGIYSFNGVSVSERSKKIRNFFRDSVDSSTTDAKPSGFIDRDRYCLNVASKNGTYPVYTICIDEQDNPFIYEGVSIDAAVSYNGELYVIPSYNDPRVNRTYSSVYKYNSGFINEAITASNGKLIPWHYTTKDYDFGDASKQKIPDRTYISYENTPSSFTVRASFDFGKSSMTWVINSSTVYNSNPNITTLVYSTSTMMAKLTYPSDARFNYLNFDIRSSTYASIDYMETYAVPLELR